MLAFHKYLSDIASEVKKGIHRYFSEYVKDTGVLLCFSAVFPPYLELCRLNQSQVDNIGRKTASVLHMDRFLKTLSLPNNMVQNNEHGIYGKYYKRTRDSNGKMCTGYI